MAKQKSFNDRQNDEKNEGYDSVNTDLPSARFQAEKQVLKPEELGATQSSIPGNGEAVTTSNVTKAATSVKSKIKIRPDASVDQLKDKQVGGVPLAASVGLIRSVAGVSGVSPAEDTSKIPYSKGEYRPGTRYGKKRSEILFEMDNTISEQIVPQVDDSLDLAESPESKQGYNGRKQFKQTRGKKNSYYTVSDGVDTNSERLPQQLLFESSVDFQDTDKVIYTCGQMIDKDIPAKAGYPDTLYTTTSGGSTKFKMQKGNYKPKALNFSLSNGKLAGISFTEDKIEVEADPISKDQGNMNWQVDENNVAKAMIRMQNELGRETTDKWSPLGYVIKNPYEVNMLYHDIEASTGAMMALAYRSAVSSLAFQKNILAKDGVNPQRNAVKMILEGYAGELKSNDTTVMSEDVFGNVIFNEGEYAKGSVAALIAMFDSVNKYSTKADILALQRSLTLHLSQADNNINPLHCKPEFIKVMDKAHMFSTVDGNYNPLLPIFTTKRIKVINPMSLNLFTQNWVHPDSISGDDVRRDTETGTYAPYTYEYSDIRNKYITRIQHPFVEGVIRWLLKHEAALVKAYGANATVTIPFEFNMQCPNMLSFMLCSASQDVLWERNICFRDIIFAGEQMTYVWDDLQGLDKLNPLYSTQLTIGKYDDPLKLGKLAADVAIREMWGTHMALADYDDGVGKSASAQYFAPWYMNEAALGGTNTWTENEGFNNEPSAYNMTMVSIRDGVRHEYVDLIKGMSERDVRLSLDRWVRLPLPVESASVVAYNNTTSLTLYTAYARSFNSTMINSNIKLAALRYEVNSDGRVLVKYILEDGSDEYHLNEKSLYAIPQELGWISDDYDGLKVITGMSYSKPTLTLTTTTLDAVDTRDGCQFYSGYTPVRLVSYRVQGNGYTATGIDRSAALSQVFYKCFASNDAASINADYVAKTGIIPCLSYNNGSVDAILAAYTLNGSTITSNMLDTKIRTIAPRIWSAVQRFFMPVNKFENCFTADKTATAYDPLEGAFYFGVCGTLASDYTQDILERLDIYDQLGLDYTEDVFVKDSLLFR